MKQLLFIRRVEGQSMSPILPPGRIIIGWGRGRPKVGQLIVFRHDGLEKIKRVSRIDNNEYFVEGDNTASSTDSRQFGCINFSHVMGRVIWPRRLTN